MAKRAEEIMNNDLTQAIAVDILCAISSGVNLEKTLIEHVRLRLNEIIIHDKTTQHCVLHMYLSR